jgi:hypothetical protein
MTNNVGGFTTGEGLNVFDGRVENSADGFPGIEGAVCRGSALNCNMWSGANCWNFSRSQSSISKAQMFMAAWL